MQPILRVIVLKLDELGCDIAINEELNQQIKIQEKAENVSNDSWRLSKYIIIT